MKYRAITLVAALLLSTVGPFATAQDNQSSPNNTPAATQPAANAPNTNAPAATAPDANVPDANAPEAAPQDSKSQDKAAKEDKKEKDKDKARKAAKTTLSPSATARWATRDSATGIPSRRKLPWASSMPRKSNPA